MLRALQVHPASYMLYEGERSIDYLFFSTVFTVHCKALQSETLQFPYQAVMQEVRMLSVVSLWNVVRIGRGRLLLFQLTQEVEMSLCFLGECRHL